MEQELISSLKIAIIGAGPCGCFCALNLDKRLDITLFDMKSPLTTLLPTGGGRCNLAYSEEDFKKLAEFYPRGGKFLYSVFSRFSTSDTINKFKEIGVETYVQDDLRVFPKSNSAINVREKILDKIKHCKFKKERIERLIPLENKFRLESENHTYEFDVVILTIGAHSGVKVLENISHKIVELRPSLVGLKTEIDFISLAGISVKNVYTKIEKRDIVDDLLFTHKGVSGPLIYKVSSLKARENFPYSISLNFINRDMDFQKTFDKNSHKTLKNILSEFLPKKLVEFLLDKISVDGDLKGFEINKRVREVVKNEIENFELKIVGRENHGEVVMSGGVDLDEIDAKTCMSKKISNLYIGGEILNIDGFCGGFNLQNCWSTAFVISEAINNFI